MANCIFVSDDDLERYSKELGISKLAVHATIMTMTEGKEVDSIPSPQEVKEYRQRNNIVAKATDNSLSEMASIKQQAIANGTFMKAPNGKPTNLTESQWLQVRTKAFKDWFGDWELVANAEKLTDEDKRTLNRFFKVLPEYNSIFNGNVSLLNEYLKSIFPDSKYRKTPFLHRSFKKIDKFKIIPGRNLSDAIWFSGRRNYSAKVGNDVLNVALLNLKNPVIYDDSGAYVNTPDKYKERVTDLGYDGVIFEPTWEHEDGTIGKNELDQIAVQNTDQIHILGTENDLKQAKDFVSRFSASKVVDENGEPLVVYTGRKETTPGLFTSRLEGYYFSFSKELADVYASNSNGETYAVFLNIRAPKRFNENDIVTIRGKEKYAYGPWQMLWDKDEVRAMFGDSDGGFMNGGQEVIVFSPNQIKSATDNNGEFSRESDNIYRKTVSPSLESVYRDEAIAFDVDPDSFNEDKASTFIENFAKYLLSSPTEKSTLGSTKEDAITYAIYGETATLNTFFNNPSVDRLQNTANRIFGIKSFYYNGENRNELEKRLNDFIDSGEWVKSLYNRVNAAKRRLDSAYSKLSDTKNKKSILQRYLSARTTSGFSDSDMSVIEEYRNKEYWNRSKRSEWQKVGFEITKLSEEQSDIESAIQKLSYALASIRAAAINRMVAARSIIGFTDLIKQRILAEYDSLKAKDPNSDGKYNSDVEKYNSIRELLLQAIPKSKDKIQPYFSKEGKYKLSDITKMISKSHPQYASLMKLIEKANFDIQVTIDSEDAGDEAAVYSTRKNTITYHIGTTDIYTAVHELVHAATSYAVAGIHDKNGVVLEEKIEKYMNYLRDYFTSVSNRFHSDVYSDYSSFFGKFNANVYGFTNPAEFLAEVFSNPAFQKVLDSVPAMEEKKFNSLFEEIWDTIVNFFNSIFGKPLRKTALDQAREIGLYAMRMQSEHLSDIEKWLANAPEKQQSITGDSTQEQSFNGQRSFRFADGTVVSTPFIPNAQQEDALNQIDEFIKSDETIMTLSGYAGTGKTSLMEMIAAKYRSSFKQIVFTATTNKAASVLKERVKKLGYEATTLHKAFGITAEVDERQKEYDAKNKTSRQTGEPKVPYYGIVVVDEASMLDEKNYQIIKRVAEGYNLKVIFLGDEAQLAPVKEDKESIVFRNPEGRIVRLTKVERTGDNAILKEATALRNGESLSGESSFNDKGQGVAFMSPNDWKKIEPIIKRFAPRLVTDPNYFRVLAYTNNTVAKYNEAIRRALGRTSAIPSVGEPIIGYNNWGYLSGAGATATYRFMNSESYVVKSVGRPTTVTHTMLDGRTVSLEAIPITIEDPMGNTDTIDFIDIKNNQQNKKNAEILAQENRRLWTLRGTPQWVKARKEKQEIEQLLFVNDVIYNEDVTTENGGHPVLQEKLWDFGYAMTIHKSQGSTFTHVIIDDADITKGTQQDGQANKKQQLEYVGVSRATDTVTVLSHNVKTEDTPLAHVQESAEDQTQQQPELENNFGKEAQTSREVSIQERFFNNEFGGNFEGGGSFFDEYNQLSGSDLSEEEQKKLQDAVDRVEEIYMGGVDIPMSVDDLNIIFNYMKKVNPEAYKAAREDFKKRYPDLWNPISNQTKQQNGIPASYEGKITPDANTVFVFGSNPEGRHGAGAAKVAREQFGAVYGQGEGLQGNAYALPTKRIKSITPSKSGQMAFSYGINKRPGIQSDTTFEAIVNGERTATTRYTSDGNIEYWEDLKVGDIVAFRAKGNKGTIYVRITKPLTKLDSSTNAEEWSKKEGWSVDYYNNKVKPRVEAGQAYQMEYEFVDANGEKTITPQQITENIRRMYDVARQNPSKQFKVAYTNGLNETTLNGYTGREMIQMFKDAGPIPSNVVFSKNWTDHWNEVGQQQPQQSQSVQSQQQTSPQQPVNNPQRQEFQWQSTEEESKEQEAPIISSEELVSERPVLNAVYPTLTIKRDRTNAIARRFSKLLDKKLDERKNELQEQLSQAEAANNDDLATSLYIKLSTLTRQSFLKSYGLKKMFEEVRDSFNPDNVTREDEEKFFEDNYDRGEGWTDEGYNAWLNERVDERVDHKKNEYRKIQENFWLLAEESTLAIKKLEHIIIDISKSATSTDTNISSELNEDNSNSENETNNVMDMEEKTPESWMNSFRSISGMDSLSQKTRAALNNLLQLDMEGYETFDDIGENRYMDPEYAHAILLYGLGNMTKSDDFEPALLKLGEKYSFVRLLYSLDEDGKPQGILEDDHQLKAAFYQDFRKDLTSYWASRGKRNPDGSFNKDTTFPLNSKENTKWLLDSWKYNTEGGIQIGGQESAFNPDSTINADAVERILKKLTPIYKDLKSISGISKERNAKIEQYLTKDKDKNWHTFVDILRSIGIDQEEGELRWALMDSKIANDSPITVFDVLEKANNILSNLQSAKYQKVDKDGNKVPVDILKEFTGYYTDIANLIGFIGENSTESSFHHLDKTRYSYTVPNYLGKVLKELKNVNSDEKRFKAYIEDNFGRYQWFRDKEHDVWFNSWIEDLVEHPELRKVLDHKVVLDFNKKGFFEAGSLEYTLGLLREFNAPKDANQAWYYVPMLSDTDSSEFIKFTKDVDGGYQQRLINKMTLTVLQEYNRIKLVRERKVGIENGTVDPIANFDEVKGKGGRGLKFCFFPGLNSWKDENGDSFLDLMDSLSDQKREASGNAVKVANINTQVRALIATALNDIIERDVDDNFKKYSELGVFDMEDGKYKYMKGSDEGNAGNREIVSKYIYNSRFATSQIIQIFATDLAYYSDATDFQKRFKEIHAPALRLYTKAEYNGKRVGKDIERSIYLADEKILSNTYEQLKQALDERVEAKILSKASRDYILKQYQNINSSDAQAYRTLDSYRAILVMSGQWNDALEQAYNNFQSGNWTIEDFSQIFQTKKPYLYTQVNVGSQVSGYGDMKVGMQHKNSEFLLLAMLPKLVEGTSMQDAFKLRAIDKFMHNPKGVAKPDPNDVIDVVNFTSAVKVGNQGVIDLNYKTLHQGITYKGKNYKTSEDAYKLKKELDNDLDAGKITRKQYDDILGTFKFKDEDEVTKHLNKVTKNGTSTITIHSASYEDYGIQTQTPEHIIDHEQLLGTQIRKLIGADITPGTILSVGDVNMTAEEWWRVYNGILVDNIAQSYEDVYERFATPEALEQLLVETIKGNDRYPNDLLNAVRLVDELDASGRPTGNKRFNIPLFDLGTAELVESLVNSIIKDNVTKQKIRGGSCIQVSSFGLSDKLKVVYDTDKNGKNTRVKYMECYMPAYAKEFYQAFMKRTKDGNYILDMSELPEELRYAIGYRVPTEDKYSMAPLKIVGFLPQQNGSAIMLPAEITTLSGSDFDVDKMYIMLPEFDVIRYDKSKAIQDFKKFNQKYAQAQSWIDSIFDIIVNESDKDIEDEEGNEITEAHADFKTWWKENKENYKLDRPKFRKIKGTFKADEDGKNASFDDGLSKKKNPSRADRERARKKRNNAIIDMMFSVLTNSDTLPRFVKPGGFEEVERQAYIQRILENIKYNELEKLLKEDSEITFTTNVSETLNSLKTDKLSDLASKYGKVLDPLSPLTQIHFHKQNSAGAKAIGIYAVNNAGQALLQHTDLSLSSIQKGTGKDGVGKINILGREGDSLHDIRNSDGEYITNNEAQYLAASVDNGKKPTLEDNGQNDFTFNMSNALGRLGFRHREISAIMNQPIIKELAEAVTKGIADGKIKDAIINEVLGKYAAKAGVSKAAINDKVDVSKATLEDFYKDRCLKTDSDMDAEYYRRQLNIGIWFKNNDVNAVAVNTVTQNLRADAQNAAAGPAVVDTVLRELKIESHINSDMGLYDPGEDYTKEEMKEHPLGFMMAFQQYGIKRTSDLLSRYFPQYSESFIGLLDDFMRRTKHNSISVETAQRLFDAAILYKLNRLPSLHRIKGKASILEDTARYLINEFPNEFTKIKKSEKFSDNPFIKSLKVVPKSNNVVVPTIMIDTTGRLTKEGKHRITQGWESLMYSGDPEAIDLATTLFAYSLVRYAGKYSPAGGFAHLVPVAVREGTKGYIDALEDLRKRGTVTYNDKDFRVMFMRNNTFDSTLFPRVSDTEAEAVNNLISKALKIDGRNKAYSIEVDSESMADDLPTLIASANIDKKGKIHAIFRNGFSMDGTDDEGKKTRKYFVLVTVDDSHAELTEVEPLGIKGAIQEYFLNNPYGDSVVPKNDQYNKENPTEYTPEDYDGSGYDVSSSESGFEITEKKDAEGQEICE